LEQLLPEDTSSIVPGKTRLRTLNDLDRRTLASRLAQDLIGSISADLGGDLTTAQSELVQRAALLGAFLEDCETRWLMGEPVETGAWFSAIDRQRRLLEVLGLKRVPRPVMDFKQYIANKERG
jgi:hypothetical protein